jgi:hypothetical protein
MAEAGFYEHARAASLRESSVGQDMSAPDVNLRVTPFNVVFCDDIRREVSGKEILIGAYSGDIVVPSVPSVLQIAMWVQVRAVGVGMSRGRIKVTDPAGNTAGQSSFDFHVGESTFALAFPALPISVTLPGPIKLYWASEGDEMTMIGEKNIRIGPLPTASLPPSGQSRSAAP